MTATKSKSKLHPADVKWLNDTCACRSSRRWLERNGFTSLRQAWSKCKVGGWLYFAAIYHDLSRYLSGTTASYSSQHFAGHTCKCVDTKPSGSCKACNAWANDIRKVIPNPFPIRRAPRATPKRAAKTAKGVKK